MDENNQYGFAMTKPLPCGCIKKKKRYSSVEELTEILAGVTLEEKLGHLIVVFKLFHRPKIYWVFFSRYSLRTGGTRISKKQRNV